jgi:predicted protein tyrosine phosphatase
MAELKAVSRQYPIVIKGITYDKVILDELDDNLPTIPNTFEEYMNTFQPDTMNHGIFNSTAPYDNPYQGNRTRILFVCSAGLLRSPTGAAVGIQRGYNTRACGSTQEYALVPLTANLINWARHIVFVNNENYKEAIRTFKDSGYEEDIEFKAHILDIPDKYEAFHPTLMTAFNAWFDEFEAKKD